MSFSAGLDFERAIARVTPPIPAPIMAIEIGGLEDMIIYFFEDLEYGERKIGIGDTCVRYNHEVAPSVSNILLSDRKTPALLYCNARC